MQCLQKFVLSLLKPGDGEAVNACAAFIRLLDALKSPAIKGMSA